MILETIRTWARGLGHAGAGVNAKLAAQGTDGDDPVPPLVKRILDTTQDAEAWDSEGGLDWPIIIVSADQPGRFVGEVSQVWRDGEITVAARYVTGDADADHAARDGLYTCRAIVAATREWLKNERQADRTLNGVTVVAAREIVWGLVEPDPELGNVVAAVEARFSVRDTLP